ncbi:MAG: hypothetical protein FWC47_16360 [Oscillospiraceae bacterium]|nr:hypothetical protein [Oscillospiraceae bacterium]
MVKATKLDGLYSVLKKDALTIKNMDDFYYDGTMEVRTGDKYITPTKNIFNSIYKLDTKMAFLFMGHQGCGKSTELNELSIKLTNEGFMVKTIDTSLEIDMQNASYWDLLILIGKKMIEMAEDCHCYISEKNLNKLKSFWDSIEIESFQSNAREMNASINAEGGLQTMILKLFGNALAEIKYSNENRKTIRHKVEQSASEWIEIIDSISNAISNKFEEKRPVIIFEDLDKLREEIAWSIFFGYANVMSDIPLYVIYTFPIALSYSPKFGSVAPFFQVETLPMIKIHYPNMDECQEGIRIIEEILFKRIDKSLVSKDALREAIIYTGGSLRDLFNILSDSTFRAQLRNSNEIEFEDVSYMLTKFTSELTKRIEKKYYDFFKSIYEGNKTEIEDKETLLEMMQAQVVLEYNATRWHDLHPLIARFLKDHGVI